MNHQSILRAWRLLRRGKISEERFNKIANEDEIRPKLPVSIADMQAERRELHEDLRSLHIYCRSHGWSESDRRTADGISYAIDAISDNIDAYRERFNLV